jgi:tRNA/rRNA methyltransferase
MKKKSSRSKPESRVNLERLTVVLNRPRLPENIGAAARAACNMGLSRLILVQPEKLDKDRMERMATPAAAHLLARMQVYDDLAEALGPFHYIVGTTARQGGERRDLLSPREISTRLIDISRENEVALLFGPENWGLTNQELTFCHALVSIPTAACSSLNLAQAVMVLAHEIFSATRVEPRFEPRWANSWELESMYEVLQETLLQINYITHQNPEHWMLNVRRFFARHGLKAREVQVIKGICRQIDWYVRRRFGEER